MEHGAHERSCLYCGKKAQAGPDLRCHLGIHSHVNVVSPGGGRHLACGRCGKYLGENRAAQIWGRPWRD